MDYENNPPANHPAEPRNQPTSQQASQPAQQPRRRRRWPWVVGGLVALGLLGLLVAAVIVVVVIAGGGGTAGGSAPIPYDEEYVSGDGADKVIVVPVEGVIASGGDAISGQNSTVTPEGFEDALEQAADDPDTAAVVLEVNSPGGGVTASDEMYRTILEFRQKTDMPVVVSMGDVAASGGYYISAAADEIVANETTLTGSLGVIISLNNFTDLADKYGYKQEVIKSGEFKDIGSSFRELKPEERKIFQSVIDESYDEFVSVIAKGRDLPEDRVREIADGRIYSGKQAKELDLVDEFGDLDRAAALAAENADVKGPTVVRYVQTPSFLDLAQARLAPQEPEAVQLAKAAGVELSPRPMYLYRTGV